MPARDEAERLPALLTGLAGQHVPPGLAPAICLFLDGCTDASAAIARDWTGRLPFPMDLESGPAEPPSAGRARGAAMALGLSRTGGMAGLLLTTDADSVPRADWVAANATALAQADVVAGRIVRAGDAPSRLQDLLEAYYDRLFALRRALDPVPWEAPHTHHAAGGASLAFRSEAYVRLGGFAPIAFGEDARILDDAARAGLRVRRDASVVVETSARRHGRAPGGLATGLAAFDRGDADVRVAHPADAAWQYRMQALARRAFGGGRAGLASLGAALGLPPDHLVGVERDCATAEAFAMQLVPQPPGGMRQVPLAVADAALALLEMHGAEAVA